MTRNNIFPLTFMIILSFMPVIFIHMPRALSFAPLLFGLIMSAWWVIGKKEKITHAPQYMYCLLGVSFLAIISVLWSIEPMGAYKHAIKISAILLFSVPLFNLMRSLDIGMFKPFLWLFPAGITLAALLASFELAFDMPIYRATHILDPDIKLSSAVMNRGVVSTTLLFFAAILFVNHMDGAKLKSAMLAIMSIGVIAMLSLSQCQSAQLAFIAGLIVIFAMPHKGNLLYKILALLIIATMFLTPWIVDLLFEHLMDNAQEIPWLKEGYAGDRVEIWNFIMKYALNNPLYGYGIEATRFITEFEHDYIYHKGATTLHPHNFSVQIWIDFGLLGVTAISILIGFVIHQISKLELQDRKIVMALFIAVLSIAATGYGMWQSWWIGEFMLLIALCAFISKGGNPTYNKQH